MIKESITRPDVTIMEKRLLQKESIKIAINQTQITIERTRLNQQKSVSKE